MTPRTRWTFDILKLTQGEDLRAEQDSSIFVHSQDRDRRPARRSSAQDQGPAQLEVIRPNLGPRVEEALDLACIGVNSRQICSLECVASLAGEVTVHESRVTSVQRRMEPRRSLLGTSVDPTEARNVADFWPGRLRRPSLRNRVSRQLRVSRQRLFPGNQAQTVPPWRGFPATTLRRRSHGAVSTSQTCP